MSIWLREDVVKSYYKSLIGQHWASESFHTFLGSLCT